MQEHELRVVEEAKQLSIKLEGLAGFIGGNVFDSLNVEDQFLLCKQRDEMSCYNDTLNMRISRFKE